MEALRIEGLSKNFGALQVFRNLNLTIDSGEYVAIIGPNGAGKSTLINVITGVLPSSSGRVYLYGQDITNLPTYRRAHIGLARSFQITRLFNDLTVLDNILLAVLGTKSHRYQMFRPATAYNDVLTKAQGLLEPLGLWQKKDQLMKKVSYGEQRKMEIALTLASEPRVLLLDEPTAGLAISEIPDFVNTTKALGGNLTLIFSAHNMDVVFGLARRVVVLHTGQFIADGTPEETRANPVVRECYLGIQKSKADARGS